MSSSFAPSLTFDNESGPYADSSQTGNDEPIGPCDGDLCPNADGETDSDGHEAQDEHGHDGPEVVETTFT